MKDFAALLDRLAYTPSRNDKLRLLTDYFAATPDPDRGWVLAALTDGLFFRLPLRRILTETIEPRVDPVLFSLSRDYVGDTAETIALIWPEGGEASPKPPSLDAVVQRLMLAAPNEVPALMSQWLDGLDANGRFALLKLVTGALRVGVSARLAKTALAQMSGQPLAEIEEVWHGLRPPYLELFAWLSGEAPRPEVGTRPVFRPLMLSHQIEDKELAAIDPKEFVAEWKWDGIRVQAVHQGGEKRLFSRTGDDISGAFPDVIEHLPQGVVLDGELLVMREGVVAPFNDLQQRLNRKSVTASMLKSHPAHIRLYDMLFEGEEDLRPLPFTMRRARLEAWHGRAEPPRTDISEILDFADIAELELHSGTASAQITAPVASPFVWSAQFAGDQIILSGHVPEAARAEEIFLATDPDREGEAISWHLHEILKEQGVLDSKPVHRVVFHEITQRAIAEAVAHPQSLSIALIHAQQARRALDYLVGFKLSPLLWKKIRRGLSAGRVQSVALRMVVDREREIIRA